MPPKDAPGQETVDLQVRVADAQGLRLHKGGEIRLVITLCASDDPQGEAFGAKVTPWLKVPDDEAPQWRARECVFCVPVERSFQAEFVDTAHLHIALMQKGHSVPSADGQPKPPTKGGSTSTWTTAFKRADLTAVLREGPSLAWPLGGVLADASNERGEVIGILKMPIGRRVAVMAPSSGLSGEEASWLQLSDPSNEGKTKGSLLLELATHHRMQHQLLHQEQKQLQVTSSDHRPVDPPIDDAQMLLAKNDTLSEHVTPFTLPSFQEHLVQSDHKDESASESAAASDSAHSSGTGTTSAVGGRPGDSSSASSAFGGFDRDEDKVCGQQPSMTSATKVLVEQLTGYGGPSSRWQQWCPSNAPKTSCNEFSARLEASEVNIFTINDPSIRTSREEGQEPSTSSSKPLRQKLWDLAPRAPTAQSLRFSQRIRSALDPGVRKQRKEVRKWRRWHEVFCILNEIEQRLGEAFALLLQASASMRRFGQSHGSDVLKEAVRLPAFLCDASLYYQSEADVPRRVEGLLAEMERIADDFRVVSLEPSAQDETEDAAECDQQTDLKRECEDLQVDVAVLLESAIIAAHQALAEYKKMHCRLELLATEYEPLCRLELDDASRPVTFLPLLADETAKAAAAALPDQAVHWAQDFSQLVDAASKALDEVVRELQRRKKQLSSCIAELRGLLLRRAAEGNKSTYES